MEKIEGKVLKVIDGDTFDAEIVSRTLSYNRYETIRINGIDTPEIGDKGATNATDRLSNRILGRVVSLDVHARDVYGRLVCDVRLIE